MNGLTGIKSAAAPIYGGTKAGIPFHTDISDARWMSAHLPFPLQKNLSVDALRDKAREAGPKTFEVVRRMFDEAEVEAQPVQTAKAILSIAYNQAGQDTLGNRTYCMSNIM